MSMTIEKYFNVTINYVHLMEYGTNVATLSQNEFKSKKKAYNWVNKEVNRIESEGDYISEVTITSEIIIKK